MMHKHTNHHTSYYTYKIQDSWIESKWLWLLQTLSVCLWSWGYDGSHLTKLCLPIFFTPPWNRGGVTFSLQCVWVSVCVCASLRLYLGTKFQPYGWTDLDMVFTKFVKYYNLFVYWPYMKSNKNKISLNGCLPHWLKPYWNW